MTATPRTKQTPLADLTPHPRNYREHPESQLVHIEQSIRDHGFYRNIVISQDDYILAGHGVVLAARRLGLDKVPAKQVPYDHDSPEAIKIMVADNTLSERSVDDVYSLGLLLSDLSDADELLGTGYDELSLKELLAPHAHDALPDSFSNIDTDTEPETVCPKCGFGW